MNLYKNFVVASIQCSINLDINPMALMYPNDHKHRISLVVNGEYYVQDEPVSTADLEKEIQRLDGDAGQLAQTMSNPESNGIIRMLRSNGFDFAHGSGPLRLNTPTDSPYKQPGMLDEY